MNKRKISAAEILGRGLLPFSDSFARADGALGNGWTGSTWAIVSNKAVNTPTLLGELFTDGGLENWTSDTNLTSWGESLAGTSTINKEATDKHGGSFSSRHDIDASNSNAQIFQTATLAINNWLWVEYWRKASDAVATGGLSTSGANIADFSIAPGTSWVKRASIGFLTSANPQLFFRVGSAASKSLYYDDITAQAITPSSMFATKNFGTSLVRVSAEWIIQPAALTGVVMCLDSTTNPQNYVVCGHDGSGTVRIIKCVGGTLSSVLNQGSVTYVAGAPIELRHTATNTWQAWYNNVQVGADQTINDAGVVSNKIHGIFSANGGSQLNRFSSSSIMTPLHISFLGDSISASSGGWQDIFCRQYNNGYNNKYNHAAAAASIMAQMDGQTVAAASDNANAIYIALGANDDDAGDMGALQTEYTENIVELRASNPSAKIYCVGVTPLWTDAGGGTAQDKENIRTAQKTVCTAQDVTYIDMFDDPVYAVSGTSDGIHPTAAGYSAIATRVLTAG